MNSILIDEGTENLGTVSQHLQARKSRQMARHLELDDDGDWENGNESRAQIKLGLSKKSIDELLFYKNRFVPLLSTYQGVVVKLKTLIDVEYISVEEFLQEFGELDDSDVCRLPIILARFEAMKVFETGPTEYKGKKNIRVMWLTEEWNNPTILNNQ